MTVRITESEDKQYVEQLVEWYRESAKARGIGIAERKPEYLVKKIEQKNSVIAFDDEGKLAGFVYIETFEQEKFVANSGLIVRPGLRGSGLGKKIKLVVFEHTRKKYPNSKVISITTSLAVMKLNTQLGYLPVTFSELTQSDDFWKGCQSCKNYSILTQNERKMCLCTGLVYKNLNDKYVNDNKDENEKNK